MPHKDPEVARQYSKKYAASARGKEVQRKYSKSSADKKRKRYATWAETNKERLLAYKRDWYKKNKPVRKHKQKAWRQARIELKATHPRPSHCEGCGVPEAILDRALCFDHDHATGKFRGWLCFNCNLILGHAKDSRDKLQLLINYLDRIELLS
jgi:Recombination endonuclease VII